MVSEDRRSLAVTSHGLFTSTPKKVLMKELCRVSPSTRGKDYLPAQAECTINRLSGDVPGDHFNVPFILNHRSLARSRFAFSFGVASSGS